jgi:hypothetical protein
MPNRCLTHGCFISKDGKCKKCDPSHAFKKSLKVKTVLKVSDIVTIKPREYFEKMKNWDKNVGV